jgi:predicted small secreted protein
MFKKIVLMVAVMSLAAPVLLTGCNTVEGAGKDIKKVGGEIQEEAAKHTDKD